MKDKIQEKASMIVDSVRNIRRHLHQHPELSFKEYQTSDFISGQLTEFGIEHTRGIAGTGITAVIAGRGQHHKRVALRADIDALPISETGNPSYKSVNEGVMHACGHDVHTASLLGAAKILHELRDQWDGSVQLVFQPGEEVLPGGASLMIREGIFEAHKPAAIFGQHVFPELPAGTVGFRAGTYMASCDELYITVKGRGGHGAKPDKTIDPVLITAHLIVSMQQVVSRWSNPQMPSVLSFGKVIANGATNIIPNEVLIHGTFRTFDETWRKDAHQRMSHLAQSLVDGMGGEIDFRIDVGYPVLRNEPALTLRAKEYATEYLGKSNVADLEMRTTAEDFAYYSHIMPACFYRLGTSSADGKNSYPVHHSSFDIDEDALITGMGLMAYEAIRELGNT
jgi:amidohydrolase